MYNNWYNSENEPLGEDGKNCVRYVGEDVNTGECVLKWNNYDCDTVAPYICEMDLVDGSNTNFP